MTSINVKLRPSTASGKEGTIYYQIYHNRQTRQISTDYRIFPHEWDEGKSAVIIRAERSDHLRSVKERIAFDVRRLSHIIALKEKSLYSINDIVTTYQRSMKELTLFNFMQSIIVQLQQMGRHRTSETYRATLRSFMHFRQDNDISLTAVDSDLMLMYEAHLHNRGISKNSISFYMRILRAVYNRAIEKELVKNRNPFKHVYTGIDKTVKRAIPLKVVRMIRHLDLASEPSLSFARDMFLFSFYTRGMSFIDMAYLKKSDLSNGILSYRRRKTGQQLLIRWERCMQEIVDKYDTSDTPYLLPIIRPIDKDERTQYKNAMCTINSKLKTIGSIIDLPMPLTMYTARHSWASAAKSKNIPIAVISEGMGHDSEHTTQIYLASLDTAVVDKANRMILKDLI